MEPSSAAASARFKLVFAASFGLIAGACAFIGYCIVRRYRRSSDLNSAGLSPKTPNEKLDTGESKNAEVASAETAKEEGQEARVDSRELGPENRDFDTNNQDSVAESNKLDVSVTGIERATTRDTNSSSHTSLNANDSQCRVVERAVLVDGDTLPEECKVFSAGVTRFLDETNGDLLSSDFNEGTQQSQKRDTWSETVTVGGAKESGAAKESGNPLCQSPVNGSLNAEGTEEAIEAKEQRKPKADVRVTPYKEAFKQKAQFLNSNDDNLGTNDRQNGESRISEAEKFSGDQSAKSRKSVKIGGNAAAAYKQESTSQDVNKEQGGLHQRLAPGNVTPTTKSALPLPLTPPPDGGSSRRQRGGRGGLTAPKQTRGAAGSQSARSGRRRWPPLEDTTAAVAGNVELDASSQQASWTSTRASGGGPAHGSPWTVGARATDEAIAGDSAGREVELFDDNFVVDAVAKKGSGEAAPFAPERRSREQPGADGGPAKDIGSLVQAAPECVLERKPLISEEEEDEEDDDDNDGHLFADHQRKKRTEEEEETTESVSAVHEPSAPTAEEHKKLVHIDENCVDSLIQLLAKEGAYDPAVQLAGLRALVNLSWTTERHADYRPIIDRLFANVDGQDTPLRLESLRVLANLSKNPDMVSYLLAAKAPGCLLKMLTPDADEELLTLWLGVLDDVLWTSKELCLTYASLPSERRAASPETVYTGLYGLKNSRVLKSRIFMLSRHRSQRVTYLASHIYSCLTS